MSDLFHEKVSDELIAGVFGVMALAYWNSFQVLTKRAERMRKFLTRNVKRGWITEVLASAYLSAPNACDIYTLDARRATEVAHRGWPLPNVHLLVSCENQETLDERIPHLLATPAAVRGISLEPLLAPVDLDAAVALGLRPDGKAWTDWGAPPSVDWVIIGGESGPGARPCNVEWIRFVVKQCKAAGVPVFVKQLGSLPLLSKAQGATVYERGQEAIRIDREWPDGTRFGNPTGTLKYNGRVILLRDPKGGDPNEWPEDLRVREYPSSQPHQPHQRRDESTD